MLKFFRENWAKTQKNGHFHEKTKAMGEPLLSRVIYSA